VQELNAASPIVVTLVGKVTLFRELHPLNVYLGIVVRGEPVAKTTDDKSLHILNTNSPKEVTLEGIVIVVKPLPQNALSAMLVRLEGREILVRLVQP
jgi:hypothetical protein